MKNQLFFTIAVIFPLIFFCFSGCSFITVSLTTTVKPLEETVVSGSGKDKILLVDISGVITDEKKSGIAHFSHEPDMVSRIKEELKSAAQDKHIQAIILRINSPGGTVTASDVIYHELKKYKKETGDTIVACIMDLGTSGGYYTAVSADKIIAYPTTVTGSIGVIMLNLSMEGLLQKIGVTDTSIKTGKYKDMGSPLKMMTDEEQKIFQDVLDTMYKRFLEVIAEGRKELSQDELAPLADGRIYTARQALDNKLIDQIGYLDEAISLTKKEAGLSDARVIVYHRPGVYKNNMYSQLRNTGIGTINLFNIDIKTFVNPGTPMFLYLWAP
ncbi:MAG: signal peptide peptidase SppA [Candidatus Brocadiaceae bacterium]|nr:signal peptide peptidase SppA [Candidatus Brocadiaceae bacterium]